MFEPGASGSRQSMLSGLFGFLFVFGTAFGALQGDLTSLVYGAFTAGFLTGVLPALITVFMAGRRPDLLALMQHVVVDDAGIRMATERASSTASWTMFRRVRETGSAYLLDFGTGAATFVPKRALDPAQRAAFLAIVKREHKLDPRSSWYWPAVGVGLGGIATILILAITV